MRNKVKEVIYMRRSQEKDLGKSTSFFDEHKKDSLLQINLTNLIDVSINLAHVEKYYEVDSFCNEYCLRTNQRLMYLQNLMTNVETIGLTTTEKLLRGLEECRKNIKVLTTQYKSKFFLEIADESSKSAGIKLSANINNRVEVCNNNYACNPRTSLWCVTKAQTTHITHEGKNDIR